VLFPCEHFALTSGSGGYDAKRIPLNERQMHLFLRAQTQLIARVTLLDGGDTNFLSYDRLAFGSVPSLYRKKTFNYGYISGVMATRVPPNLRQKTFPSERVIGCALPPPSMSSN